MQKIEDHRLVCLEAGVETGGRTDGETDTTDRITFPANTIGKTIFDHRNLTSRIQ